MTMLAPLPHHKVIINTNQRNLFQMAINCILLHVEVTHIDRTVRYISHGDIHLATYAGYIAQVLPFLEPESSSGQIVLDLPHPERELLIRALFCLMRFERNRLQRLPGEYSDTLWDDAQSMVTMLIEMAFETDPNLTHGLCI